MNVKKVVGILLVLFLGLWMSRTRSGFAQTAKTLGDGTWTALTSVFQGLITFIDELAEAWLDDELAMRAARPTDPDIGRHLLREEGEVIVDEVRKRLGHAASSRCWPGSPGCCSSSLFLVTPVGRRAACSWR